MLLLVDRTIIEQLMIFTIKKKNEKKKKVRNLFHISSDFKQYLKKSSEEKTEQ